ncbi:hypothetical protein ACIQOW_24245 [Kitasatospora sp. NPDC091335]|uniref:hypothetical protein n=1 Tax=Kitasatospora sp. NPDC091335 TaxID=3364085 RepID=UPI0038256398
MNTTDLAPHAQQPVGGNRATADHPAGEIRLRGGGALGRRSRLLHAPSAFRTTVGWTTIVVPVADERP